MQELASKSPDERWEELMNFIENHFGKRPENLKAVLFLIGVQELGQGVKVFTKEQKQDLMHIAICRLLSSSGVYELEGHDEDGWPHWKLVQNVPHLDILSQEELLKSHILEYFAEQGIPE